MTTPPNTPSRKFTILGKKMDAVLDRVASAPSPLADQVAPSLNAGKSRESRDEGTPSAAPVTPERLAEIRHSLENHANSVAELLLKQIDWQAAKIAELEATIVQQQGVIESKTESLSVITRGYATFQAKLTAVEAKIARLEGELETANTQRNHDINENANLKARLTAAQSFVPKAVDRYGWQTIGNMPREDGTWMRYTDHAAIVADLTTALNLANAEVSRLQFSHTLGARQVAAKDAEIVALREAIELAIRRMKAMGWDLNEKDHGYLTNRSALDGCYSVMARTSESYAGKTVVDAVELAELRKDRARQEWIESMAMAQHHTSISVLELGKYYNGFPGSLRIAIDAAMAASPAQPEGAK